MTCFWAIVFTTSPLFDSIFNSKSGAKHMKMLEKVESIQFFLIERNNQKVKYIQFFLNESSSEKKKI